MAMPVRHPDWGSTLGLTRKVPLEERARELDLNYVKLDGSVGIIGNGAGLVMSTLDVVAAAGADLPGSPRPANFLDIGGGASARVMANGLNIILSDPQVKSVFVNVFRRHALLQKVATGIVDALGMLGDRATRPLWCDWTAMRSKSGAHPGRSGSSAGSGARNHGLGCPPSRRTGRSRIRR